MPHRRSFLANICLVYSDYEQDFFARVTALPPFMLCTSICCSTYNTGQQRYTACTTLTSPPYHNRRRKDPSYRAGKRDRLIMYNRVSVSLCSSLFGPSKIPVCAEIESDSMVLGCASSETGRPPPPPPRGLVVPPPHEFY